MRYDEHRRFSSPSLRGVTLPAAAEPALDPAELRPRAEKGDVCAEYLLGEFYQESRDDQNDVESAKWYRKAAEQGHTGAQMMLAAAYDAGRGVKQNHAEATAWYRKAAEKGFPGAAWELGFRYSHGELVPRDYAEAAKWFRMDAERGSISGALELAGLYRWGRGVKQDPAEAYFWYSAFNVHWASLNAVVDQLTPEQRAAVHKRVKEWKPIPYSLPERCPR